METEELLYFTQWRPTGVATAASFASSPPPIAQTARRARGGGGAARVERRQAPPFSAAVAASAARTRRVGRRAPEPSPPPLGTGSRMGAEAAVGGRSGGGSGSERRRRRRREGAEYVMRPARAHTEAPLPRRELFFREGQPPVPAETSLSVSGPPAAAAAERLSPHSIPDRPWGAHRGTAGAAELLPVVVTVLDGCIVHSDQSKPASARAAYMYSNAAGISSNVGGAEKGLRNPYISVRSSVAVGSTSALPRTVRNKMAWGESLELKIVSTAPELHLTLKENAAVPITTGDVAGGAGYRERVVGRATLKLSPVTRPFQYVFVHFLDALALRRAVVRITVDVGPAPGARRVPTSTSTSFALSNEQQQQQQQKQVQWQGAPTATPAIHEHVPPPDLGSRAVWEVDSSRNSSSNNNNFPQRWPDRRQQRSPPPQPSPDSGIIYHYVRPPFDSNPDKPLPRPLSAQPLPPSPPPVWMDTALPTQANDSDTQRTQQQQLQQQQQQQQHHTQHQQRQQQPQRGGEGIVGGHALRPSRPRDIGNSSAEGDKENDGALDPATAAAVAAAVAVNAGLRQDGEQEQAPGQGTGRRESTLLNETGQGADGIALTSDEAAVEGAEEQKFEVPGGAPNALEQRLERDLTLQDLRAPVSPIAAASSPATAPSTATGSAEGISAARPRVTGYPVPIAVRELTASRLTANAVMNRVTPPASTQKPLLMGSGTPTSSSAPSSSGSSGYHRARARRPPPSPPVGGGSPTSVERELFAAGALPASATNVIGGDSPPGTGRNQPYATQSGTFSSSPGRSYGLLNAQLHARRDMLMAESEILHARGHIEQAMSMLHSLEHRTSPTTLLPHLSRTSPSHSSLSPRRSLSPGAHYGPAIS